MSTDSGWTHSGLTFRARKTGIKKTLILTLSVIHHSVSIGYRTLQLRTIADSKTDSWAPQSGGTTIVSIEQSACSTKEGRSLPSMRNLRRIEDLVGFGAIRGLVLNFCRLGRRSQFRRGRPVNKKYTPNSLNLTLTRRASLTKWLFP